MTNIIFFLKYHTDFGACLYITTNHPDLACIEMQYFNQDYWRIKLQLDPSQWRTQPLRYNYFLLDAEGSRIDEFQTPRELALPGKGIEVLNVYDSWNHAGAISNTFYTAPFQQILLPQPQSIKLTPGPSDTHIFTVQAPLLQADQVVCLLGDSDALNGWDVERPILLKFNERHWIAAMRLPQAQAPFAYKYGIYDQKRKTFLAFEQGDNRVCFEKAAAGRLTFLQDGFLRVNDQTWRGAGVSIPVFGLRSQVGLGIGEFNDLKLLVDWAVQTGLKLIQILPVNDTVATHTWRDSYPYAAISAFALHPIYIHLDAVQGKQTKAFRDALQQQRQRLNELAQVDYEEVMRFKMEAMRTLFEQAGARVQKSQGYRDFFAQHQHWLRPYSVFCFSRDQYGTPDPSGWQTNSVYDQQAIDAYFDPGHPAHQEVLFYCYVQYELHLQLSEAVTYARQKGIVLKGDIPIGVYRLGCDAWMAPALYKMDQQAGAPPDDFAVKGQNWGFPTYNWAQMQRDDFAWWRRRFEQMSHYFDAFRIDHILGFFRIWSIPLHAVQGIMGRFDPCLPVEISEFGEQGIWFDYERFCMPYITDEVLNEIFGDQADSVRKQFLQKHGPQQYLLRPAFDTQQKLEAYFSTQQDRNAIQLRDGLYDLVSNVLLFEQEGSDKTAFHFRIAIDQTSSFRHLQPHFRERIWNLYIDYFYRRQDDFWRKESLKKLPQLKAATAMLICGEDLGMVPESVPGVMKDLGILSLEIQRMPKQSGMRFFNPGAAPYLSVVTPSTHDMSTIRGWWQEDGPTTQEFYNSVLGQSGAAPLYCEPWINRAIVLQHLYAPAMWSIFQLQDLLGMSAELRREHPEDERINIPADPRHYWRYRMHLTLEQLLQEKSFNQALKGYIINSGRG